MLKRISELESLTKDQTKKVTLYKKTITQHETTITQLKLEDQHTQKDIKSLKDEVAEQAKQIRKLKSEAKNNERGDHIRQEEYWQLKEDLKQAEDRIHELTIALSQEGQQVNKSKADHDKKD